MKIRKIKDIDIRKLFGVKSILLVVLIISGVFVGVNAYKGPSKQVSSRSEMRNAETKNVNEHDSEGKTTEKNKAKDPSSKKDARSTQVSEPVSQAMNSQSKSDDSEAVPRSVPTNSPEVPISKHLVASSYSVKLGGSSGESRAYVDVWYASGGIIEWLQVSKQSQFQVQSSVSFSGVMASESQLAGTSPVAKRRLTFWQYDGASSGSATVYVSTSPQWQPLAIRVSWSPILH